MPLEDFTTYVEVDTANDRIQRTATHVDHLATRNEDTYLYKDRGAGHFTDFAHKVHVKSELTQNWGVGAVWMLSNDLDDIYGLIGASKDAIWVWFYRDANGNRLLCLYECDGGTCYAVSWTGPATNTWYFLTIEKSGTSLTCKIYSDSARTNLLDTLSLTLHHDYSFRYVFACNTYNVGTHPEALLKNDVNNLDLQEVPPPGPPAPTKTLLTLTL